MRIALATVFALAACSKPVAVTPADIKVAGASAMKACVSVGVVEERVESPSDVEHLKEELRDLVKERAAKLRATHLVFVAEESDNSYGFAKAEAYRCKR